MCEAPRPCHIGIESAHTGFLMDISQQESCADSHSYNSMKARAPREGHFQSLWVEGGECSRGHFWALCWGWVGGCHCVKQYMMVLYICDVKFCLGISWSQIHPLRLFPREKRLPMFFRTQEEPCELIALSHSPSFSPCLPRCSRKNTSPTHLVRTIGWLGGIRQTKFIFCSF